MALILPARLLTFLANLVLGVTLGLAVLIAVAEVPVTIVAYARPLLPPSVWLWGLLAIGGILTGLLIYTTGARLHRAARGADLADTPKDSVLSTVVAHPVDEERGWNTWDSVHLSHGSARSALYGGWFILLGVILQGVATVVGAAWFTGPVEVGWQWPLLFGERLFNTMLLGIPASVLPTFSAIGAAGSSGEALLVAVDICYALGVISFGVATISTAVKVREIFSGTTRDLADYLDNFDLSRRQDLTIHRVAVVRPLDEENVLTLSKAAFFERVRGAPPAPD